MRDENPRKTLSSYSGTKMLRQFQRNETGLGDTALYRTNYDYTFTLNAEERERVDRLVAVGAAKADAVRAVLADRGRDAESDTDV